MRGAACGATRCQLGRVQVSTIFIDESGAKNSSGGFFVVGFIKVRATSKLRREMHDVRQRHRHFKEAKFGEISRKSLPFYFDVVEMLAASDARIGGSVYDARKHSSARIRRGWFKPGWPASWYWAM